MKISIVTISYNQAEFIEETIRSVINQECSDLEYIVVDAGSTDGSRRIINRYRRHIDKIIFEPDTGPADGLNKGLAHATGDLFGYINADDVYLPGTFNLVSDAFRNNDSSSVVYGHGIIIDSKGKRIRRFRSGFFTTRRFVYGGSPICQQATFFRRTAIRTAGGFNPLNKTCWDAELLLKLGLHGYQFKRLDNYLGAFRIHEQSITGSQRYKREYQADCDHYFKLATGRNRRSRDMLTSKIMRVTKWVHDPKGLAIRLQDYSSRLLLKDKNSLHAKWR